MVPLPLLVRTTDFDYETACGLEERAAEPPGAREKVSGASSASYARRGTRVVRGPYARERLYHGSELRKHPGGPLGYTAPFARSRLSEQTNARIPRAVLALRQPGKVRRATEERPGGRADGARPVQPHGIDRNHEIER